MTGEDPLYLQDAETELELLAEKLASLLAELDRRFPGMLKRQVPHRAAWRPGGKQVEGGAMGDCEPGPEYWIG